MRCVRSDTHPSCSATLLTRVPLLYRPEGAASGAPDARAGAAGGWEVRTLLGRRDEALHEAAARALASAMARHVAAPRALLLCLGLVPDAAPADVKATLMPALESAMQSALA